MARFSSGLVYTFCALAGMTHAAYGQATVRLDAPAHQDDPEAVALFMATNAVGLIEPYAVLDFSHRSANRLFDQRPAKRRIDLLWENNARFSLADIEGEPKFVPFLRASIPDLEKQAELFPSDANVLTVLGVRLFQSNHVEQSVAALARAWQADPNHERCAEVYSGVLVYAGDMDAAVREIRLMMDTLPHNRVIRFNAACAYARQTNVAQVVYHLGMLADLGWHDVRTHFNDRDLDAVRQAPEFVRLSDVLDRNARERILSNLRPPSESALSIRGQL